MNKETLISVKKNQNGSYTIFLQYCKEGVYLKSTGITLKLNEVQVSFVKRKNKIPSSIPNYEIFNEKIEKEQEKLNATINQYFQSYKDYPTQSQLESYIKYCSPEMMPDGQDFLECFKEFIKFKEKSRDVKQYVTLLHHFERFLLWNPSKKVIHFSDLQINFFMEFFSFLSQKSKLTSNGKKSQKIDVCDNAIHKLSYNLASAINGFRKYKFAQFNDVEVIDNIHLAIENLKIRPYESIEIIVTHEEIEQLANFKLKDEYLNGNPNKLKASAKVLERIKFLFILQTTKGTRHSDLHQLCMEKLFDNKISILQKKTNHQYSVKVDDLTIELMSKGNSGQRISNQKYNEYLKLVFKQFYPFYKKNFKADDISYKLDGIPIIKNYLGVQRIVYKNRFELVKTHTARRSYVSVAKIKHRMTDLEIQHDIGQTNPKSLDPYKVYYEEHERLKVFDFTIKD